jgi:mRNA-degrading endonuclease RelE of RelBE toxin-antitoxin system
VEVIISPRAERDLRRLDRGVAQRVANAIRRYAQSEGGDVRRLTGIDELRLRVGDWRVRFVVRTVERRLPPPASGSVQVRVMEVLRVLHRSVAYHDV